MLNLMKKPRQKQLYPQHHVQEKFIRSPFTRSKRKAAVSPWEISSNL
jgi:hypothetical protein